LSQYPVFKVQAQRDGTLLVRSPAVNSHSDEILGDPAQLFSGDTKRPRLSAGGVGLAPVSQPCWLQRAYPIALTVLRAFNPCPVSEELGRSSLS